MVSFVDNEAGKSSRISLKGDINIYCSDEIKEVFMKKMNDYDSIYLDHENAAEMDISYLQILFSAIQTSAKKNKKIFIENKSAHKLNSALVSSGFNFNSEIGKLINTAINTETEN